MSSEGRGGKPVHEALPNTSLAAIAATVLKIRLCPELVKKRKGGSSERTRDSEQEQSRAGSPACSRQSLGTFQDMRACPSRRGDLVGGGGHPRQSQKSHKSLAVRHRGTHPSKPVSARERSYAPAPTCLTRPNPSGSKGHRLSFRHKNRPCVNQFVASATRRFFGRAWPLGHAQPDSP